MTPPNPDKPHDAPYGGLLTYKVEDLKRRVDALDEIPRRVDRVEDRVKAAEETGSIRDTRLWKIETTLEDLDLKGLRRDMQLALTKFDKTDSSIDALSQKVDGLRSAEDRREGSLGTRRQQLAVAAFILSVVIASIAVASFILNAAGGTG